MPDEIAMVREGNRLAPVDEVSAEELSRVPLNQQVLVEIRVPRNIRQHRLAFALAAKIAEACDFLHDRHDAMDWLKIKARHVRFIHNHHTGETQIIPKSIRFASLDQQTFSRVLSRMIYVTTTEIIPGLDETSLRHEIESMVGIDGAEPPKRKRSKPGPAVDVAANTQEETAEATTKGGAHTRQSHQQALGDAGTHSEPPDNGSLTVARTPKNAAEWVDHSVRWLTEAREKRVPSTEITARWTKELALRLACNITGAQRDKVFELYTEVLDDLRVTQ